MHSPNSLVWILELFEVTKYSQCWKQLALAWTSGVGGRRMLVGRGDSSVALTVKSADGGSPNREGPWRVPLMLSTEGGAPCSVQWGWPAAWVPREASCPPPPANSHGCVEPRRCCSDLGHLPHYTSTRWYSATLPDFQSWLLWSLNAWAQIPVPSLSSRIPLGKLFYLFVSPFPHLKVC